MREGGVVFRRRGPTMHDTDEPTMVERPAEPVVSPIDGMAQSMLFTLLGAAALIVSAFLEWIRPDGIVGADLSYRVLFDADFGTDATFARSAGAVVIGIG